LVEEFARKTVCTRATDAETSCLPRYVRSTTTWLSILHRFERLLMFDVLLGAHIAHQNGNKTTVQGTHDDHGHVCLAVSSYHVMRTGAHYAEFRITGAPLIGIVRPMPGLDSGAYRGKFDFIVMSTLYPVFLAQKSEDWGDGNVHACDYGSYDGGMSWTNWDEDVEEPEMHVDWEGMERSRSGDTVGMLLDLDEGTLTVYRNNHRLGVMKDGLSGPYCWYTQVEGRDTVAIQMGRTKTLRDHGQRTLFDYEFSRRTLRGR